MRTLLWKEFRENWKWGVLLLVASAIGHAAMQSNERRIALFTTDYLMFAAFGFSLGALLLGVLQTVFEAQRDRWAYLRHRAITPERILLAKVIVGLSLYAVAVLIPLLLLTVWSSIPGKVPAPFHWSAPLNGLVMLLAGAPYWFAGALIGVRDVRWYGTRLLPVGGPIMGTAGMVIVVESVGLPTLAGGCAALIVFAATMTAMAVATAGAFRNRTGYLNQTRRSRWCLALSSAVSLGLLACAALMTIGGTLEDLRLPWMWPSRIVLHEIDRHGRLIRWERAVDPHDPYARALCDLTVVDQGEGIAPSVSVSDLVMSVSLSHGRSDGNPPRFLRRGFGQDGPYRRLGDLWANPRPHHWFFDPNERVLLGYEQRTRRLTWRAGPDGIVPADQPVAQRFSSGPSESVRSSRIVWSGFAEVQRQAGQSLERIKSALDWTQALQFEDGLYLLDHDRPRLSRVYAVEAPDRLIDLAITQRQEESAMWMVHDRVIRKFVLTEGDRVLAPIDPNGHARVTDDLVRGEFTIPNALQGIGQFGFAELPEKNLVVYRAYRDGAAFEQGALHTFVATPEGKILRHIVSNGGSSYHQRVSLFGAVLLPAIPATTLTAWWSPAERLSIPGVPIESVVSPPSREFVIVMWASSLLSLLVTALLVWHWRFSRTSSLGWLAATAVLGPAGLLTLLTLRERVLNVACSGCHKPRPRTSERCPHCGQYFAEPERNGTEIFATLAESKLSRSIAEPVTR